MIKCRLLFTVFNIFSINIIISYNCITTTIETFTFLFHAVLLLLVAFYYFYICYYYYNCITTASALLCSFDMMCGWQRISYPGWQ